MPDTDHKTVNDSRVYSGGVINPYLSALCNLD